MADYEERRVVISELSTVIGNNTEHPLARAIAEATGLPTTLVEPDPYGYASQFDGAMHAASVALKRFGAQPTIRSTETAEDDIDAVLAQNERFMGDRK